MNRCIDHGPDADASRWARSGASMPWLDSTQPWAGPNLQLTSKQKFCFSMRPMQGCVESSHGIDAPDRAQRDASASGPWSMHRFIKRHRITRQCIELPHFVLILSTRMSLSKNHVCLVFQPLPTQHQNTKYRTTPFASLISPPTPSFQIEELRRPKISSRQNEDLALRIFCRAVNEEKKHSLKNTRFKIAWRKKIYF